MLFALPSLAAVLGIRAYQYTLSPDHGWPRHLYPHGYCRFHPTCSEYGVMTIQKRGLFIGSVVVAWRILRCNPWSKGGIDLPK